MDVAALRRIADDLRAGIEELDKVMLGRHSAGAQIKQLMSLASVAESAEANLRDWLSDYDQEETL